jgi:arsenate reductase (glutaredoxin)
MSLRVYAYKNCDTCRRALKWLEAHQVAHEVVPIREQPPTEAEHKAMLRQVGDLRRLFNTSGQDYKTLNMKDRLPKLSEAEALALLAQHGNLVKRPFAISAEAGTTGFDEEKWRELFL